jgi:hypothetical protein
VVVVQQQQGQGQLRRLMLFLVGWVGSGALRLCLGLVQQYQDFSSSRCQEHAQQEEHLHQQVASEVSQG